MLDFKVIEQALGLLRADFVVSDSVEYLQASFDFSQDWDGYTKTAVFTAGVSTYNKILTNDVCTVPFEVLTGSNNNLLVSVFGVKGTARVTTNTVNVKLNKSGYVVGQTPGTPSPDVYAQLLTALDGKADKDLTNKIGAAELKDSAVTGAKLSADAKALFAAKLHNHDGAYAKINPANVLDSNVNITSTSIKSAVNTAAITAKAVTEAKLADEVLEKYGHLPYTHITEFESTSDAIPYSNYMENGIYHFEGHYLPVFLIVFVGNNNCITQITMQGFSTKIRMCYLDGCDEWQEFVLSSAFNDLQDGVSTNTSDITSLKTDVAKRPPFTMLTDSVIDLNTLYTPGDYVFYSTGNNTLLNMPGGVVPGTYLLEVTNLAFDSLGACGQRLSLMQGHSGGINSGNSQSEWKRTGFYITPSSSGVWSGWSKKGGDSPKGFGRIYFKKRAESWTGNVRCHFFSSTGSPAEPWTLDSAPVMAQTTDGRENTYYADIPGAYDRAVFLDGTGAHKTSELVIPPEELYPSPLFVQHTNGVDGYFADHDTGMVRLQIVSEMPLGENTVCFSSNKADSVRTQSRVQLLDKSKALYTVDVPLNTDDLFVVQYSSEAGKYAVSTTADISVCHGYPSVDLSLCVAQRYKLALYGKLLVKLPASWKACQRVIEGGASEICVCIDPEKNIYRCSLPSDLTKRVRFTFGSNATDYITLPADTATAPLYDIDAGVWAAYPTDNVFNYYLSEVTAVNSSDMAATLAYLQRYRGIQYLQTDANGAALSAYKADNAPYLTNQVLGRTPYVTHAVYSDGQAGTRLRALSIIGETTVTPGADGAADTLSAVVPASITVSSGNMLKMKKIDSTSAGMTVTCDGDILRCSGTTTGRSMDIYELVPRRDVPFTLHIQVLSGSMSGAGVFFDSTMIALTTQTKFFQNGSRMTIPWVTAGTGFTSDFSCRIWITPGNTPDEPYGLYSGTILTLPREREQEQEQELTLYSTPGNEYIDTYDAVAGVKTKKCSKLPLAEKGWLFNYSTAGDRVTWITSTVYAPNKRYYYKFGDRVTDTQMTDWQGKISLDILKSDAGITESDATAQAMVKVKTYLGDSYAVAALKTPQQMQLTGPAAVPQLKDTNVLMAKQGKIAPVYNKNLDAAYVSMSAYIEGLEARIAQLEAK